MNTNDITFNYVRNRIREYERKDLLEHLFRILTRMDLGKGSPRVWDVLTLLKWTYLYAGEKYPSKALTPEKFQKLWNNIVKLQDNTLLKASKASGWHTAIHMLSYQQFYLQTSMHWTDFARQLKLYDTLVSKYDINQSFYTKTGLHIPEFIQMLFVFCLHLNLDLIHKNKAPYKGYLNPSDLQLFSIIFEKSKTKTFLNILSLDDENATEKIKNYRKSLKNGKFQPFEISVFTMYPFLNLGNKLKVVHRKVYTYTCLNYIYDFLKENDKDFPEEFGRRFEKYVELGLQEVETHYKTENNLKKEYGKTEKITDFVVEDTLIIECKGIEQSPLAAVNPYGEIAKNAMRDSIIKAYTKQMLNIASKLKRQTTKYGLIITYKEFYFSSMEDIWEIVQEDVQKFCRHNNLEENPLPPERVFIINIKVWDMMVQAVKDKKATWVSILEQAVQNNRCEKTKQKYFASHLEDYDINKCDLSYLKEEYQKMDHLLTKHDRS
ncbi:hypothetical protein [Sinomicrobium oceani]|uniref:hypothetical protein n=1 Tax=Sinomicrobium oceani TaxID=1150368 RepID=UPI00227C1CDF|nr:hypothetical protein [Sinomicrobium oceani]